MLETMIQTKFSPLPWSPLRSSTGFLDRFGKRNIWHGMLPKSFCACIFSKYRDEAWISKHIYSLTVELHRMWLERSLTCKEITSSRTRIRDHEIIKNNVKSVINSKDILLPELEVNLYKVGIMTSEILPAFLHECFTQSQDYEYYSRLTDHSLNIAIQCRPETSEAAS